MTMNKKTTSETVSGKTLFIEMTPKKITLDKISQFARTYTFEKNLPAKLASYVIN